MSNTQNFLNDLKEASKAHNSESFENGAEVYSNGYLRAVILTLGTKFPEVDKFIGECYKPGRDF